jgi:predicted chitinase
MPDSCSKADERGRQMPDTACDGGATTCSPAMPCTLKVQSETVLTNPSNRSRTRVAVGEQVRLTASGAQGNVNWTISGKSTLDATSGNSVLLTAHQLEDTANVALKDSMGCNASIQFTVIECCFPIKQPHLQSVFTAAAGTKLAEMKSVFDEAYDKFFVDTCLRKAHFFAQLLQEVGTSATNHEENLNYTPERLKEIFGYFKSNPDEAEKYGRVPGPEGHPADQEAIANRAYGNRLGNGDIASGDGWKYRGKGYIQLTGKNNYTAVQAEIDARFPKSGIDIIKRQDDILTIRGALISAMAFWSMNGLHNLAAKGGMDKVVDSITAKVNFYTDSYAERKGNFKTTKKIFETDLCPRKPDEIPEEKPEKKSKKKKKK